MTMLTVGLVVGQLMAQTTKKLAQPQPPKVQMQKMELPPPPPAPPNEINELVPPPPPAPSPPKAPKAHKEKVKFVAPKIVKDKEI